MTRYLLCCIVQNGPRDWGIAVDVYYKCKYVFVMKDMGYHSRENNLEFHGVHDTVNDKSLQNSILQISNV